MFVVLNEGVHDWKHSCFLKSKQTLAVDFTQGGKEAGKTNLSGFVRASLGVLSHKVAWV